MPVPSTVNDLDPVASNNSPPGSEPIGPDLDAYLRAHAAIIRQVSDASKTDVQTHAGTSKATPVDADELPIADSAASFGLKKLTWANMKAALKTFLQDGMSMSGALTLAGNAVNPLEAVPKQQLEASLANAASPQLQAISASVASNALTLTLPATNLDFRSSTQADGTVNRRTVSSPISLVVPSGATLGTVNGQSARLVMLAIDNAGTVELAVVNLDGGVNLDETTLISTTAISAAASSANTIYSTGARTNVPFRVVGFTDITQVTAGTWASGPTRIQGAGGQARVSGTSMVRLNTANGYGSTNTKIRRLTNVVVNQGADITYADSATLGASFTINASGVYAISYGDQGTTAMGVGLSLNTSAPTTNIQSIPVSQILSMASSPAANGVANAKWTGFLKSGDIVRPHTDGVAAGTNVNAVQFTITRVS